MVHMHIPCDYPTGHNNYNIIMLSKYGGAMYCPTLADHRPFFPTKQLITIKNKGNSFCTASA